MPSNKTIFRRAAREYFVSLRQIANSGSDTPEASRKSSLHVLLDAVGSTLRPQVTCIPELADQSAGHPDGGLFTARQLENAPTQGQLPERGVVEVKPISDDAWRTANSDQVSRYWAAYGMVLVTNFRDFILVSEDESQQPRKLETFRLATTEEEFVGKLEDPRAFASEAGVALCEYLARVMTHATPISDPGELARLLAHYARLALSRVEGSNATESLSALQQALEQSLDIQFTTNEGAAFFRSTLVQTLFYGMFSAWVLWARQTPAPSGPFDWRNAVWQLRAPVLRTMLQQITDPDTLRTFNLVEVLDWAGEALNRVDSDAFFAEFNQGVAIPYFYQPFLDAFDPKLRKKLGVWYTPPNVVEYMVARVDMALKQDLGIPEGLAGDNVYVLDPCCGTGAYLAATIRQIAANIRQHSRDALTGSKIRKATIQRIFGFEIMPAPFAIAHLLVDLTLQELDAPLPQTGNARPNIFLTNALTGWESREHEPLLFPALQQERERADRVKQKTPVLVILGNPPYNGFAGIAETAEERELTVSYRNVNKVRRPEGQGPNDLYVRFFRMAERRITEKTGQGVVCFISNYSWLDGLSSTGMRERYLEVFDAIRIDCLNGDKYRTGKTTPDGEPDPSIFSTPDNPTGIQIGTAISTLVRKADHSPVQSIGFRHLWGQDKHETLAATAATPPHELYRHITPSLPLGLPFADLTVSDHWQEWPALPDLFLTFFPGVKSGRDPFVVDIDLKRLKKRVTNYFDTTISHDEIARRYPSALQNPKEYDARAVRDALLKSGGPMPDGFVRYAYRPFDTRWLYWESREKLVDRPRVEYKKHLFDGNLWMVSQQKPRKEWSPVQVISNIGCLDMIDRGSSCFPAWIRDDGLMAAMDGKGRSPNLTPAAQNYLTNMGLDVEDLFHHVVATLHDPVYRAANAGALQMEWPHIPLPDWPDGKAIDAAETLAASASRGRQLAALLDPDTPVNGVTTGSVRQELSNISVPSTIDGSNMKGRDFALSADWGSFGEGGIVMPRRGTVMERDYKSEEQTVLNDDVNTLGHTTFDVYINDRAYWRNVPAAVWNYHLGGYPVLKKWLSYREEKVLDRKLRLDEVEHFSRTARRIAAILMLTNDRRKE